MTLKFRNSILIVTGVVLLFCAIFIMGSMVISLVNGETPNLIKSLLDVSTAVAAVIGSMYVFAGATKDSGAGLLKMFFILNIAKSLICFANIGITGTTSFVELIGCIIPFAGYCIFYFATNLGKTRSVIIASAVVIIHLVCFLFTVCSNNLKLIEIATQVSNLIISVSVAIFIWAKYKDKESRGRA